MVRKGKSGFTTERADKAVARRVRARRDETISGTSIDGRLSFYTVQHYHIYCGWAKMASSPEQPNEPDSYPHIVNIKKG